MNPDHEPRHRDDRYPQNPGPLWYAAYCAVVIGGTLLLAGALLG